MKKLTLIASALLLVVACTKARDQRIGDESLEAQLIAKSELEGIFTANYGGTVQGLQSQVLSGISEKPIVPVTQAQVPGLLRRFFDNVPMRAKPGSSSRIAFVIKGKYIFVERSLADDEKISPKEQGLIETPLADKSVRMIPMFAIEIVDSGVLIPKKNDVGDTTTNLELRQTDIATATHLKIDTRTEKVLPVGIGQDVLLKNETALVDPQDVSNKVLSKSDLERVFNKTIPSRFASAPDSKLTVRFKVNQQDRSFIAINVYSVRKKSELTTEMRSILESGQETNQVLACSDEIKKQLPAESASECVLQLESQLFARNVQTQLDQEASGAIKPNVITTSKPAGAGPTLLEIGTQQIFTNTSEIANDLLIPVSFFKDKEYYFRRTFKNAASTLMAFGPGASGTVELVRFELERDRVVVRKVLAANGDPNPSVIDREELMSLPAEYFQTKDSDGETLTNPLKTVYQRADAVYLNWTDNKIPVGNSPLAFFEAGQCFNTVGHQIVDELDQRLAQGILNFTIKGSYTFQPSCMSYFGMNDYWYQGGLQVTYNLDERLSFMVNDGALDKLPNQDLAFRAQSMMGFGSFTMGSKTVDPVSGNTNLVNAEIAHPVIQDFSKGRVVTYVLGGLPADPTYRELVIQGSKKAVDDWNEALHKAFAGTSLDRTGNYLELKVEGVDISVGQLGDLDRNYIWNYDKKLDSNLLGLSQAGPNPRSGYVISNNVLMYSGNLLSYVAREKEMAQIQKQYESLKAAVLAESAPTLQSTPTIQANASSGADMIAGILGQLKTLPPVSPRNIVANGSFVAQKMADVRQSMIDNSAQEKKVKETVISEKDYVQRIFQKAVAMHAMHDSLTLEALSASEILKAYGNSLTADQRKLLSLQSRQLALRAEFAKALAGGPNCFLSVPNSSGPISLLKSSTEEIFFNWYASTLSHELGHGLGLTHNFKGSTDKANFEFSNEKLGREYSSIMDYLHPNHEDYHKPGPYDVHALRAAYTGLIEVSDAAKKLATTEGSKKVVAVKAADGSTVKVELVGGAYAQTSQLKDVYLPARIDANGKAFKSWFDMDARALARLPLKNYSFCTDIDVGGDPMCQRFDYGTTPSEVVAFRVKDYQDSYPVYNARNANINIMGLPNYVGRVMGNLYAIRSFLDEAFFEAISGYPQSTWVPYAQASITGLTSFAEIIGTPTSSADVFDSSRFSVTEVNVPSDRQGQPPVKTKILVEKKALRDQLIPGVDGAVQTRGIEIDKMLAMQLMTIEDLGNPRYSQITLRVSYADFETMLLGSKPAETMTLGLVRGALSDNLPSIKVVKGSPISLGAENKVEVSDSLRFYGILGATLLLDNTASQDDLNPSRAFLVGRSQGAAPTDRLSVTRLGSSLNSPAALKLWAYDTAFLAKDLVAQAARSRAIIDNKTVLVDGLQKLTAAITDDERKIAKAALVTQLIELNKNEVLMTAQEATELNFEQQIDLAEQFIKARTELVNQVLQIVASGTPITTLAGQIEELKNRDQSLIKSVPLLAAATQLVNAKMTTDQQKEVAGQILSSNLLESNHTFMVGTLEQMTRIITMLHPELSN